MTKLKLFGAALIMSAAIATPALAEVISEPGLFAFYHPMGDLGIGASSRPSDAMAQSPRRGDVVGVRMSTRRHATRHSASIKHY